MNKNFFKKGIDKRGWVRYNRGGRSPPVLSGKKYFFIFFKKPLDKMLNRWYNVKFWPWRSITASRICQAVFL
jgi:hypothetical protein